MCTEAGVLLLFLPPYSPDFNPIEEAFHDLKDYIRHNNMYIPQCKEDFEGFLSHSLRNVASRAHARAHFKNSMIDVSEVTEVAGQLVLDVESLDGSSSNEEDNSI
jgi:hypothetical protein